MKRRYDLLYALGALVSSPVWAYSLFRTGKWRTDWPGRFGKTEILDEDPRPTLLIHGVSVGEINATRELVARLSAPDAAPIRLVVSATTNTGFARARELYGHRLHVVRFPFDFSWMVGRFLDALRPDALALMELELWPNLAEGCRERGIPLAVLNGRLSHASFRNYRWIRPLVRPMFEALSAVGAQTEEYARRFQALGTFRERITVTDTMKWDPVKLVDHVEGARELRNAMGMDPHKPLVVAGSTGPGEEALLLEGKPQGVQLLLVPRKPERFQEVARLVPDAPRRSLRPDGKEEGNSGAASGSEVFLLDTMGELTKAYSLADVAVVGRSLVPMGGSDPIEAIALGKATVMGPHHENFQDVVEAFREGGGIRITSRPWREIAGLLADPEARAGMGAAGREVIRSRQGATEVNVSLLRRLLEERTTSGPGERSSGGRIRRVLLLLLLAYLAAGYLTSAVHTLPAPVQPAAPPTTPLPAPEGHLWSGVFSVHTNRSHDARGTRADVARAAWGAGLDFVVVGDHPPDDRKPGWAFWDPVILDGVLVEGGQELRSPVAGKILAVGVDTTYKRWEGEYPSFVEMLAREGATAFVVHGRGPRGSERWVNPDVQGVQGWEVLDISEFAKHRLRGPWSLYHLLTLLAGTPLGLGDEAMLHLMREGFDTPTVAAYDSLRMAGPLTATAGLNTHPKVRLGPVLIPGYGSPFLTLVSHLRVEVQPPRGSGPPPPGSGPAHAARAGAVQAPRTGPAGAAPAGADQASAALMAAARRGDLFISLGRPGPARGFRMGVVEAHGGPRGGMGGRVPLDPGIILRAGFQGTGPEGLLYRILRNGREVAWVSGPELEWPIPETGIYRVEVYLHSGRMGRIFFRLRPWIFTNPVEVG